MDWAWEQDETWKCSAGRDYISEDPSLTANSHVTTLLRDTKETGLPLQTHPLREFEKSGSVCFIHLI
ncbi:hypothetical protein scyTo_0008545 [Scyliorhinus torazame]|uniref:Uncharacterized protein n=1 Tax=Scyliorhinus torazame TaxID=75743 RepID=A0A401PB23_SCYTO|nr:hypothetical protein [Scyliorhinus torazame]